VYSKPAHPLTIKSRFRSFRLIIFVLLAAFQATWYGLLIKQLVAEPQTARQVDYVAIYTAGYIARYDGLDLTYNLPLQKQVESAATSPVQLTRFYPYNHTPHLVRILQLITDQDIVSSFYRFLLVLLFFHLLSVILLARLMYYYKWPRLEIWMVALSGLLFYPIFAVYLKGQDSAFLLLGVTVWAFGVLTGRDKVAGLGLALAAFRPQVALVLALPFLFKRRQVWWWFVAWGCVFLVYFFLLIGFGGMKDFIGTLLLSSSGIDVDKMPTLMGAVARAFPNLPVAWLFGSGYAGYGLVILGACLVWAKSRRIGVEQVGLAVLLGLAFSPHLHTHDLSLLLIPVVAVMLRLVETGWLSREKAAMIPIGFSMLLLINGVLIYYSVFYIVMLALGVLLWLPTWLAQPRKQTVEL
jgi:hypothetical protein